MDKNGFSILETLFSIVIIAIILTPIPNIINSIAVSAESVNLKESMFLASSKLMESSASLWDEYSEDNESGSEDRILETSSSNFVRNGDELLRSYGIFYRTFFNKNSDTNLTRISATAPSNFKREISGGYSLADIDDWNGTEYETGNHKIQFEVFYVKDSGSDFGEKDNKNINLIIDKLPVADEKTSSLKYIQVTGFSKVNNNSEFQFHYISTNIGTAEAKFVKLAE